MQSQPTLPKQDLLSQLNDLPDKMSPEMAQQLM